MSDNHSKASDVSPIRWPDDHLELLDQTVLPDEEVWLECRRTEDVAGAIRRLSVRGAPAIGVAAAYGLVVALDEVPADATAGEFDAHFEDAARYLAGTRPTAVNLRWALDRGKAVFREHRPAGRPAVRQALFEWAEGLHADDVATNRRIGAHGAALFAAGDRALTHCNAGALATAGWGTAVGVIRSAWESGKVAQVWVDETRPLLQGARLTAWELKRLGIPHRLVTDSSAGALLSRGLVERVVVGADRIAANGDTANKIGTYPLAVLAERHGVPFYVAAPLSTIDRATPTGADIPIEEREGHEVTEFFGRRAAPLETAVANFAFDVTPAELITAIITEVGVLKAPFGEAIAQAFAAKEA
ncbi:MAG: S-methyl-5-thioribose-1-phosphate isomerase [Acidobacteriota bacterium]